jgi:hypothetical protein
MSRNGSGTYNLPAGNPVVTGTTISSTWANTTLTDIANALTGSLAADGQTTATGNLNMGTNKITNAGDPTNSQDVATKYYTDTATAAAQAAAIAAVTPANVSDKVNTSTGYFQVPRGTALQRPVSPVEGLIRYNSDSDFYEGYINGDWVRFQTFSQGNYTGNYVIAAGGGGGGGGVGGVGSGGGGAGGYLASSFTLVPGTYYYAVVGAGGAANTSGTNSSITGIVSTIGGGYGGNGAATGGSGGSGGGASGAGTSGQGNAGGASAAYLSGAGGGAGAAGGSASPSSNAPAGGVGLSTTISGSTVFYCGGGGAGGVSIYSGGAGGNGGGGRGGTDNGGNGTAGTVNTGGGGGAGSGNTEPPGNGASGGSGVVIISVPTANYTGTVTGAPTVTTNGGNTVIKFTSSGTYLA